MSNRYKAGGPLTTHHDHLYVERDADVEVLRLLNGALAPEYVLVVEPRQQGKTSFANHLMLRRTVLGPLIFVYLDLEDYDCAGETDLCAGLWEETVRQCRALSGLSAGPSPVRVRQWRERMEDLADIAAQNNTTIVVILDEVESLRRDRDQPWSRTFFAAIRKLHNLRNSRPSHNCLAFLLLGAFYPGDLIPDGDTSPFNICRRIRLDDFTQEQVTELVRRGGWEGRQLADLSERIHYWTGGQPYLTQLLCSYLEPFSTPDQVDNSAERVIDEDDNHLRPLLERLRQHDGARELVRRVCSGERIPFPSPEERLRTDLELFGIIKKDSKGYCVIRNRIYERALLPRALDGFSYDVFVSYSHEDKDWVVHTLVPHLETGGLRVHIDYRDFEPGVPSLVNIEKAIKHSRKTLLVITPDWIASEWAEIEGLIIQTTSPANRGRRFLPLILRFCTLPDRLRPFTYLDFTDPESLDVQLERLVRAIRKAD